MKLYLPLIRKDLPIRGVYKFAMFSAKCTVYFTLFRRCFYHLHIIYMWKNLTFWEWIDFNPSFSMCSTLVYVTTNPKSIQLIIYSSSLQSLNHIQLFVTPWATERQAPLSITNSWSLLKLMSVELVMPSSHLILYCPLLLLPSIFPSIRVFSNESVLRFRWLIYWSFSFRVSPSNEYSGLISFRMDWLNLVAVQDTLESSSTPQFKSINFFGTQLSL